MHEKIKTFITLLLFVSSSTFAGYSKPKLLARLSSEGAFNAPDNTWCFTSEPTIHRNQVYLSCLDEMGYFMGHWGEKFNILARAETQQFFSFPLISFNRVHWYEYNEFRTVRSFEFHQSLRVMDLRNLGPAKEGNDSFLPVGEGSWFYRVKNEIPELKIWRNGSISSFFNPQAAFIFTPQISRMGEIAFKTRDGNFSEESPDRIWHFRQGKWSVVLEDQDANPRSPWISFRHQLSVEGDKIVTVAKDRLGEALILIQGGQIKILARAGRDFRSIDFFTPKMAGNTVVVRGDDLQGRKTLYVYNQNGFQRLLTQGDIIQSDLGPARVHYHNRDALFYGAPGIDERGTVVFQATLTDPNYPSNLLGIGILKFEN